MEWKEEAIKKIVGALSAFEEVELGYIFGSFHEGREFRDVDVAILLSDPLPPYESERLAMRVALAIEKALDYEFELDVKVLNHSPVYFQHEVIKNGRLIFCRDEAGRVRYEGDLLSEYMDYRDVLDWFDEKLLARA
jgi:predicted nucleotidyltransferase